MTIVALVLALVAGVFYLVAALGGSFDSVDLVLLGHTLLAFAVAAMNLMPWPRIRP